MRLHSPAFDDGEAIPERFAFGVADPAKHMRLGPNRNPPLAWSGLPEGTRSLVLVCHDPDVPSRPDDVNQEGRAVPEDLPRCDFFHWVLVDLDPALGSIAEGAFSDGVTPKGKPGPAGPLGTRQGINDYTAWFDSDFDMAGDYYGYDGPCPPWNDERLHHYVFTLYALGMERCLVEGRFTGPQILKAIRDHVLDSARLTGFYTLNPDLRP